MYCSRQQGLIQNYVINQKEKTYISWTICSKCQSADVASLSTSLNQTTQKKNQLKDDFHFEINNPNLSK